MQHLVAPQEFRSLLHRFVWIPGVVVVVIAALSAWQMRGVARVARDVERSTQVIDATRSVEKRMLDQETNLRGFVISGDAAFLAPYEAARQQLRPSLDHLASLVADERDRAAVARGIDLDCQRWDAFAQARLRTRSTESEARALALQGKEIFDAARAKMDELARAEEAQRARLQEELHARTVAPLYVLGAIALLGAGAFALFGWSQVRRVSALHANALDELERRTREVEHGMRRFELAAETMGAVVYESDVETGEVIVVGQHRALFGFEPHEYQPTRAWWMGQIHSDDARSVVPAYLKSIAAGGAFSGEYRFRQRDGRYVQIWHRSVTLAGPDGRGKRVLASMIDVSERKRLEERMLHNDKLESIGRLASGIAHDFNNVTTAVLGYSELAEQHPGLPEAVLECLHNVRKAGERSANLTSQLLTFARKQVVQPRALDLDDVVRGIGDLLRNTVGELVELAIIPTQGLAKVRVDRGQFEGVLLHLASNGRDAMPSGGVLTIETSNVTIGPVQTREHPEITPGAYVRLTVHDTGAGMSDDARAHVFEPFFAATPDRKGTGLALASVYGAVKQAGGHIRVDSAEGRGTTFEILLPVSTASVEETRREPAAPLPRGRATVLLAEDEPQVRALAARVLRANGYTVIEATNGQTALTNAQEHIRSVGGSIDLLVADVVMPGMGGRELAQQLAKRWPKLKVLFASGYTEDVIAQKGDVIAQRGVLESGYSFLPKPFTPSSLVRGVHEALARSTTYAELNVDTTHGP